MDRRIRISIHSPILHSGGKEMTTPNAQMTNVDRCIAAEVDSLYCLASEMSSCIGRMKNCIDGTDAPEKLDHESLTLVAQQLCAERTKLIEGWTALEAEQRRQLVGIRTPVVPQVSGAPRQVRQEGKQPQTKMDRGQQFRLLQRDCDRQRDR